MKANDNNNNICTIGRQTQCVKPVCPETIVSFTRFVDTSSGTTIGDQIDEHMMNSSLSDEECEALEIVTRLQLSCQEWREHTAVDQGLSRQVT